MRYGIYAIREEHTGTSDRFSLRGNCDPLTCFLFTNVVYSLTRWHVANLVAYFKHLNSSISSIQFKDKQSGCFSSLKYSKTCVKLPLSKIPKFVFKTNYRLMQVKVLRLDAPLYISGPILVKLHNIIKHHQVWKGKGCMWFLG